MNWTRSFLAAFVVTLLFPLVTIGQTATPATEINPSNYLDAPTPMISSSDSASTSIREGTVSLPNFNQPKKKGWLRRNDKAVISFSVSAFDMIGTGMNMLHARWLCGYRESIPPGYANVTSGRYQDYGNGAVVHYVHRACGSRANYAYDVVDNVIPKEDSFIEEGWASAWGICGNRDASCVISANIASDIVHFLLVKHFEKRGGWEKRVADITLLFHGEEHVRGGLGNFISIAQNNDPNAWGRNETGVNVNYPKPRWWGAR